MKKVMLTLCMLLTVIKIDSSNLCWGYPAGNGTGKRLRSVPIEKITTCTCECWKYSKTKGDNNFYICTECRHRLTPEEVLKKSKHNKFKRWSQK